MIEIDWVYEPGATKKVKAYGVEFYVPPEMNWICICEDGEIWCFSKLPQHNTRSRAWHACDRSECLMVGVAHLNGENFKKTLIKI